MVVECERLRALPDTKPRNRLIAVRTNWDRETPCELGQLANVVLPVPTLPPNIPRGFFAQMSEGFFALLAVPEV